MTSTDNDSLLDGIRTGAWLDAQDFPPVRWVVDGIIPEGLTLLVGAPKIGKSWLVLGVTLAAASGGRILGSRVEQRPVLYLALEDGDRRMQDRCRKLLMGEPIPPTYSYMTRTQPGAVIATVAEWMDLHHDAAPIVVLDTLGKVMPPAVPGESSYGRDYRIGGALKRVVDEVPGASLVVVHHDRKAESADFIESVSGSNGLAGSADTIVLLHRPRHDDDGTVQVTGRDVPEGEYAVRYTAGCRWELVGSDLAASARVAAQRRNSDGLGDRSTEVVGLVTASANGVRAADVAERLGISPKHASTYLARLADAGRITKAARGLYRGVGSVGSVGFDGGDLIPFPHNPHNPQPPRGAS